MCRLKLSFLQLRQCRITKFRKKHKSNEDKLANFCFLPLRTLVEATNRQLDRGSVHCEGCERDGERETERKRAERERERDGRLANLAPSITKQKEREREREGARARHDGNSDTETCTAYCYAILVPVRRDLLLDSAFQECCGKSFSSKTGIKLNR